MSPSPLQAWWLSAGALQIGGFTDPAYPGQWEQRDLYEIHITDIATLRMNDHHREICVLVDVAPERVEWVGQRAFDAPIHAAR